MKGKVIKQAKGKDEVVRGVIVLHKGNHLERPIELICPLEPDKKRDKRKSRKTQRKYWREWREVNTETRTKSSKDR